MRRPSLALSVATIILSGWCAPRFTQAQLVTPIGPVADIIPFVDDDPWTMPKPAAATMGSDSPVCPLAEAADPPATTAEHHHDADAGCDVSTRRAGPEQDDLEEDYLEEDYLDDGTSGDAAMDASFNGEYADDYEADARYYESAVDDAERTEQVGSREPYDEYAESGYDEYEYDSAYEGTYEREEGGAYEEAGSEYEYEDSGQYAYGADDYEDGVEAGSRASDVTYEPQAPAEAQAEYVPFEYEFDYLDFERRLPYEVDEADYESFVYEFEYDDVERPLPYEVTCDEWMRDTLDDLSCRMIDARDRFHAWMCESSWIESTAGSYELAFELAIRFAEAIAPMQHGTVAAERDAVAANVAEGGEAESAAERPAGNGCFEEEYFDAEYDNAETAREADRVQDDTREWHARRGDTVSRPTVDGKEWMIGTALLLDQLGETLQRVSRRMLVHAAR